MPVLAGAHYPKMLLCSLRFDYLVFVCVLVKGIKGFLPLDVG